jgi:hypothetical protein
MTTATARPTTSPECSATGCTQRWVSLIPADQLSPALLEAMFGIGRPQSYRDWETQPQGLRLCRRHYRITRRSDGYTLGYHRLNGKTRAYVIEEHF